MWISLRGEVTTRIRNHKAHTTIHNTKNVLESFDDIKNKKESNER